MSKILILLTISLLSTNSARWYAANIENEQLKAVNTEEERLTPILMIEPHRNKSSQYSYDTTVTGHRSSERNTFETQFQNDTILKYRINTEESKQITTEVKDSSNVGKNVSIQTNITIQPKRQLVSRRCIPSRKSKQAAVKFRRTPQSRFLEVFEVIDFHHVACTTLNGLEGTCIHEYNCHKAGGLSMGACADGCGTCCVVQFTCESRSSASVGWFTNQEFPLPSSDRLSCTVSLDKAWPNVQQYRLDFLSFEMLPPTSGNCEQDQFIVTGQNVNNVVPILCGINSGQHVYIEVGYSEDPINLSIQTVTAERRLFAIKITQLTSTHKLAAPTGCLQYFQDSQAHLESFNYRDRSEIILGRIPGYMNNLNYAMCIERQVDTCSVTYTNVGYMQIPNYDVEGLPILPPRQAGVEIFNCPSDWLLISAVRLCGERLNDGSVIQDFSLDAPVTDDGVGPIVIWFRTDGVYTGRGFKLHYHQNSCSNKF